MAKWIPGVATFGLICLMVLPAPGIWGLLIGGICVVAIIGSALVWAVDEMLSRVLARYSSRRNNRTSLSGRAIHAGSGIAKRGTAKKLTSKRA